MSLRSDPSSWMLGASKYALGHASRGRGAQAWVLVSLPDCMRRVELKRSHSVFRAAVVSHVDIHWCIVLVHVFLCPPGEFLHQLFTTVLCRPCKRGTVSPKGGTCVRCQSSWLPNKQQTACLPPKQCPWPQFSPEGYTCKDCPRGEVPNEARTACALCPSNQYLDRARRKCSECRVFQMVNTQKDGCVCESGTYNTTSTVFSCATDGALYVSRISRFASVERLSTKQPCQEPAQADVGGAGACISLRAPPGGNQSAAPSRYAVRQDAKHGRVRG